MSGWSAERDDADALARELERLVGVDHSPEFRARVRQEVARHAETPVWRGRWILLAAGTVAAAVMIMISQPPDPVTPARVATGSVPVATQPSAVQAEAIREPGDPAARPPSPASAEAIDASAPARAARAHAAPSVSAATVAWSPLAGVDIVISSGEVAELRRLFRQAAAGRLEPTGVDLPDALPMSGLPELESPALSVEDLTIQPVPVSPLPPIEALDAPGVRS